MTAIPEAIMDEARRLIAKIEGCTCMDCEDAVAESLLAAEQRGAERATIRGERAVGRTIEEMRGNVSPDLTKLGDTVLAWVNEGDLIMSEMRHAAIRNTKD